MKMQESNSVCAVLDAPHLASREAWLGAACVVVGCLAMSLAAQVRVPLPGTDVPMTLQLLAVFMIGFALRPALAVSAMVLYVACGASGLPVFAGSGGLFGATAGYIVGFVPAVWLVSVIGNRRDPGIVRLLVAGICGASVVFALGVAWRIVFLRGLGSGDAALGIAVATGVVPFAVKAFVELALAAVSSQGVRRLLKGRRDAVRPNQGLHQV